MSQALKKAGVINPGTEKGFIFSSSSENVKFYYAFARSVEEKVKVLVCASYSLVMNSYPIPDTPKKLKKGAN